VTPDDQALIDSGRIIVRSNTSRRNEVALSIRTDRARFWDMVRGIRAYRGDRLVEHSLANVARELRREHQRRAATAPVRLRTVRDMYRAARASFRISRDIIRDVRTGRHPCGHDDYLWEQADGHRNWARSVLAYARTLRGKGNA
jgi:hypothetical protein